MVKGMNQPPSPPATSRSFDITLVTVIVFFGAVIIAAGLILLSSQTLSPSQNPQPSSSVTPQPSIMPVPVVSAARNWAGYVAASDMQNPQPTVVGVNGSWTVPAVTETGSDAFSAVWIGIGGEFDQTLIQIGTEQDSLGGQGQYSAWYELLPADSVTIGTMDVFPGDRMEASIRLSSSATNRWTISITDITTGQSYQRSLIYSSGQFSADWIVERPVVNNVLSALADFGNVTFTNCLVTFQDTSGTIGNFPNSQVIMDTQLRRGQLVQLVDVSSLTRQGDSFNVTYLAG